MKTYEVTITETLEMTVEVEAKNRLEAEQIISDRWKMAIIFSMRKLFKALHSERAYPNERMKDSFFGK